MVDLELTPDWHLAMVFNRHSFHELGCGFVCGGFLIFWAVEHHLSRWQFLGIFLLVPLPYGMLGFGISIIRTVIIPTLQDCTDTENYLSSLGYKMSPANCQVVPDKVRLT